MIITDFARPFTAATQSVLLTMCKLQADIGEPRKPAPQEKFGVITGILGMSSPEYVGNLFLRFEEGAIVEIVNKMLSEEFTAINQDIIDAVGELTNIIVGVAKRDFEKMNLKFDMASPAVAHGSEIHTSESTRESSLIIPCRVAGGAFQIKLAFEPKKST